MNHDIIVIGASAGGVEAVPRLLGSLSAGIRASFFVTLHISPNNESYLPVLISRHGLLPAEHPRHGSPIRPGRVYVAPPDYHLMLGDGVVLLGHGPKENRHRPAIDPLFRSAAQMYGERVAGVLLTGNLDDGVSGLSEIQRHQGLTIVQDPTEAPYPQMPRNALLALKPDHCLPLKAIEDLLKRLPNHSSAKSKMNRRKSHPMSSQATDTIAVPPNGSPVAWVCPECQGPLWELHNGKLVRYQCLVGHRYSLSSLLEAHAEELEAALWIALRTLEERISLHRRLLERSQGVNNSETRKLFQQRIAEHLKHAKLLRTILEKIAA